VIERSRVRLSAGALSGSLGQFSLLSPRGVGNRVPAYWLGFSDGKNHDFFEKKKSKNQKNHDFFDIYPIYIGKPIKVNYYVKYCYTQCVNTTEPVTEV